jgi:hypothetical protein
MNLTKFVWVGFILLFFIIPTSANYNLAYGKTVSVVGFNIQPPISTQNIVDNDFSTTSDESASNNQIDDTDYVQIDLGNIYNLNKLNVKVGYRRFSIGNLIYVNIKVSSDGSNWVTLDTYSTMSGTEQISNVSFTNINAVRYIRSASYSSSGSTLTLINYYEIQALIPDVTITTNSPTSTTSKGAVISGNITAYTLPVTAWFEWGRNPTSYLYRTANQIMNVNDSFSSTISGMPILAGTQYYYRAVANNGAETFYGNQQRFTTTALSQIPDYNFDQHFNELTNAELNPQNMSAVATSSYTDIFGNIFWGILFSSLFIFMWIRSEDVTIPSLLGMIIGGSLWAMMPPEWVTMAMSLTIVSFGGLVYSLIRGRS